MFSNLIQRYGLISLLIVTMFGLSYIVFTADSDIPPDTPIPMNNLPPRLARQTPALVGTPPNMPAPLTLTADPTQHGPDLMVQWAWIELENGNNCESGLGVTVMIGNIGNHNAGQFLVDLNGFIGIVDEALAGDYISIWYDISPYPGFEAFIVADSNNDIIETDETNNTFEQFLPIPTLPLQCINSPTPTMTATTMAGEFSTRN